ncbi:MAG: dephospho-CoA kinase [Firmicutes bacterium]|nr:dephospho-CoA kinase [Bacillota bacterium]
MKHNIIAIVGMCGSGKSVASDILEQKGYKKVYFGGVTMEKLKEAGLEVTPENEKMMQVKLREEHGMGAYAKLLLPRIKEYSITNDTVLDGLYSWDELKILKDEFGDDIKVIAIIADKDIRYDRLSKREVRPFTKEEAIRRDINEIERVAKGGPIAFADYYIINNSDLKTYKMRLEEILEEVKENEKSKRFVFKLF